jgi:ATP-dependent 26S proteasome regulatory subunit
MSHEDPGNVSYGEVGGLSEQIRELREVKYLAGLTVVKLYITGC